MVDWYKQSGSFSLTKLVRHLFGGGNYCLPLNKLAPNSNRKIRIAAILAAVIRPNAAMVFSNPIDLKKKNQSIQT